MSPALGAPVFGAAGAVAFAAGALGADPLVAALAGVLAAGAAGAAVCACTWQMHSEINKSASRVMVSALSFAPGRPGTVR